MKVTDITFIKSIIAQKKTIEAAVDASESRLHALEQQIGRTKHSNGMTAYLKAEIEVEKRCLAKLKETQEKALQQEASA